MCMYVLCVCVCVCVYVCVHHPVCTSSVGVGRVVCGNRNVGAVSSVCLAVICVCVYSRQTLLLWDFNSALTFQPSKTPQSLYPGPLPGGARSRAERSTVHGQPFMAAKQ